MTEETNGLTLEEKLRLPLKERVELLTPDEMKEVTLKMQGENDVLIQTVNRLENTCSALSKKLVDVFYSVTETIETVNRGVESEEPFVKGRMVNVLNIVDSAPGGIFASIGDPWTWDGRKKPADVDFRFRRTVRDHAHNRTYTLTEVEGRGW